MQTRIKLEINNPKKR